WRLETLLEGRPCARRSLARVGTTRAALGRYGRRWWRGRDRGARGLDEARRRRGRRRDLERRPYTRRIESRPREIVVDTRHVRIHASPEAVQQRLPGTAQGGGALGFPNYPLEFRRRGGS